MVDSLIASAASAVRGKSAVDGGHENLRERDATTISVEARDRSVDDGLPQRVSALENEARSESREHHHRPPDERTADLVRSVERERAGGASVQDAVRESAFRRDLSVVTPGGR